MNKQIIYNMKKILLPFIAALAVFAGCKKETLSVTTGVGELTLSVECGDSNFSDKPMLKSGAGQDISDFQIVINKLTDEYGEASTKTWEYTVGTFPKVHEFAPGTYDIAVSSPAAEHVSYDAPSYYAYETFTIIADKVTVLDVVCAITNMKVSVAPTDNFFRQLSEYNITVTAEYEDLSAPVTVVWTQDDFNAEGKTDKVAYFDVAPLSVMVTGKRTIDGSDARLDEPFQVTKVAAKDHHIINVDVQLVGQLQSAISIRLDGSLNEMESDLTVDGFEEIPIPDEDEVEEEESVLPTMVWASNPDFQTITIEEGLDVNIDIYAPRKIETFIVRVSKNFEEFVQVLTDVDADAEVNPETGRKPNRKYMDLIGDQVLFNNLADLNLYLPHGSEVLGKDYVAFSLSSLVPLITTVVDDDYVTFTLELVDREKNTLVQDLTFYSPKK